MKLDSITLQNFKGIDNLEIKLDNKTTVIFGVNGVGKSTILQAIDLLYADIIAKLMGTVRSKTARFNEDFISYGKSAAGIKADFDFGDGESIYYAYIMNAQLTGLKVKKEIQVLLKNLQISFNRYIYKWVMMMAMAIG